MIEVEVKLAIGPAEPEARRLEELGALLLHPRSFEDNVLLDRDEGILRARGAMLRVRRYGGRASLTYKEPAPGPAGYKIRTEWETSIPEPDVVIRILEAAGLRRVWRYVKYRTVFRIGDLNVLLDETPIGNFLELEGPREAIDAFAGRLGRSSAEYLTASYRALQEEWCRRRGTTMGDMEFETGMTS